MATNVPSSRPTITDDVPLRLLVWRLAWPAVGEMTLFMFAHIADMIMVGQLGPAAVAAVSVSGQPVFLFMGLFQALAVGSTALVARFAGAGDRDLAERAAGQALWTAVAGGLVVAAVASSLALPMIRFMGAGPDVIPLSLPYFRLMSGSMPLAAAFIVMASVVRGAGDTMTPMKVAAVSNVVNVIGNYLLIFGKFGMPELGVTGAGVATALSRGTSAALLLFALTTGRTSLRLGSRALMCRDLGLVARALRVGLPATLEQLVMRGGQLLFVRVVAGLGTLTLAAHQIALNIESLAFMPAFGIGTATATIVGQSLGAGRPDLARNGVREARLIGISIMAVVGVLLFTCGRQIVGLYTRDQQVIEMGAMALRIMAVVQPAVAINLITAGGLRGAGDTRWVLASTSSGIWLVRLVVGSALAVGMGWGLAGAWTGMALDQCTRSALLTWRFVRGRWHRISV